jgi:hypothetical protein
MEAARSELPRFLVENVDAAMEKQLHAFIASQVKNRRRTKALLELIVTSQHDEELRAQLADNVKTVRDVTARILRQDVDDPDVDLTLATLWGLALLHLLLEDRRPDSVMDDILERFAERRVTSSNGRSPKSTERRARSR